MKKLLFLSIAVTLFLAPRFAGATMAEHPGCSGNCLECHTFEKTEAEAIVKKLKDARSIPPETEVKDVKLAPAGGLWQIDMDIDGKPAALFVDITKRYLLNVTQIVPIDAIKKQEPKKVDFSSIPLKDAVLLGAKKAKKKIVVFTDPDCPYCRRLHEELKEVLAKRKDVAFYLMLFPLPMHKDSYPKVQAVLCERSLNLADAAFAGKAVPDPKCGKEAVERNIALAGTLQVNSTPTLIRDDGLVLNGALPIDRLIEWIDGK